MKIFFSIVFCLGCGFISAQPPDFNKKASKLYEKADKMQVQKNYAEAMALLEECVSIDPSHYLAYEKMAHIYAKTGLIDSTYSKFESYLQTNPRPSLNSLEFMAYLSFEKGDYQKSKSYLDILLRNYPNKKNKAIIKLLSNSHTFVENQLNKSHKTGFSTELPSEINKYQLQYLPTISADEKVMLFTRRKKSTSDSTTFPSDEDLLVSYKINGRWSPSASISPKINTDHNEGASTISADGKTIILTSCEEALSYGSCDLYISKKQNDDTWSYPVSLGPVINTKYWESQPSLSADGNTLYFSSNRPNGMGGRDIWMAKFINDRWTTPQNLGEEINTFRDETTPFIHFTNKDLYFSSNGHPGMGGFDLFHSKRKDSTWQPVKNLEYPINTYLDEAGLVINPSGSMGYFAREIRKGKRLVNSKIRALKIHENIRPAEGCVLEGRVEDVDTKKPLAANIQIINTKTGGIISEMTSDSITGRFFTVFESGLHSQLYVRKKGYLYSTQILEKTADINTKEITIPLEEIEKVKTIVINDIYFDFNSYEIREESYLEINKFVNLMSENPQLKYLIEGHTDNIGLPKYNLELSGKRAREVYLALIEKGIDSSRLQYKGIGDKRPKAPNDTEENQKLNRRIEFQKISD